MKGIVLNEHLDKGPMEIKELKDPFRGRWMDRLLEMKYSFHMVFFLFILTFFISFSLSRRWGYYQFFAGLNFILYILMIYVGIKTGFIRELHRNQ